MTAFCASSKTFALAQKTILLNANYLFVWHKMFVTTSICKKKFGPAQNILGPVKGQGIRAYCPNIYTVPDNTLVVVVGTSQFLKVKLVRLVITSLLTAAVNIF